MTNERVLEPDPNGIPKELKNYPAWVCWQSGKVPINPKTGQNADPTDPAAWGSFDQAWHRYKESDAALGVGYVFHSDDPFVGFDLDDCRESTTGEIDSWAIEIIEALSSTTFISSSGTGIHIIAKGSLPPDGRKSERVEMYELDRYFALTGIPADIDAPYISKSPQGRQKAIDSVHSEYIADSDNESKSAQSSRTEAVDTVTVDLNSPPPAVSKWVGFNGSDAELLRKARQAENGDLFADLFRGRWEGYTDRWATPTAGGQSEADLALCRILAFYTGPDPKRIDRLFRGSGLYRRKWDRNTYRKPTIRKAVSSQSTFYAPRFESISFVPDGGKPEVSVPVISHIVHALWDLNAASVTEITSHHAVSRSERQIRRGLQYLEDSGFIDHRRAGRKIIYELYSRR